MSNWQELLVDFVVIAIFMTGIAMFRSPQGARRGNLTTAAAFAAALGLLFYRNAIGYQWLVWPAVAVGGFLGYYISVKITMTAIPALIALQNGAGGGASLLVSLVELARMGADPDPLSAGFAIAGALVGGVALSGSVLAAAKLENRVNPRPKTLPAHNLLLLGLVALTVVPGVLALGLDGAARVLALAVVALSPVVLGIVFAMRVGGADMPVMISLLNAFSGLAGAFVGVSINNPMLIAAGAMVGSSGTILTLVMAKAMNRGIGSILVGRQIADAGAAPAATASDEAPHVERVERQDPLAEAREALAAAQSVIIIPGYGMAMAQAQREVAALALKLQGAGKQVRFAVHPVAGRMPGHMHVLLAEADVEYDNLFEMDDINDDFAATDVALIVGACDVVNPAANSAADTPISGMPILNAEDAGTVIVCNLNEKPGYSGVPNTLYDDPRTILLFGDAKERVTQLLEG